LGMTNFSIIKVRMLDFISQISQILAKNSGVKIKVMQP
jgi:hypothetical protein